MPKKHPYKKRTIKKMRGGATINYLTNMEDDLNLFLYLIQFLTPQEIIRLYNSEQGKYMVLIEQVNKQYPNFTLKFNYFIDNEDIIKLQRMGFKLDISWTDRTKILPNKLPQHYDPLVYYNSDDSDY